MNRILLIALVFLSTHVNSQTGLKDFFKLSGPKKSWVLKYPFKAKKVLEISLDVKRISDSLKTSNLLDGDLNGGQLDAFRHAYWMARLKEEIGEAAARSLGKAHEKENYKTYKKNKLEDGVLPDKISTEMDLWNNEQGLKLVSKNGTTPKIGLIYRIVNAIHQGKMKVIKKDKNGNFLTCDGEIILKESLVGKWENKKCLLYSK